MCKKTYQRPCWPGMSRGLLGLPLSECKLKYHYCGCSTQPSCPVSTWGKYVEARSLQNWKMMIIWNMWLLDFPQENLNSPYNWLHFTSHSNTTFNPQKSPHTRRMKASSDWFIFRPENRAFAERNLFVFCVFLALTFALEFHTKSIIELAHDEWKLNYGFPSSFLPRTLKHIFAYGAAMRAVLSMSSFDRRTG